MRKRQVTRQSSRRRPTTRRLGQALERLEERAVLSGASPVAVNDLFHSMVDQPLEIGAPGILANDTDAEGDALAAGLFSGPAHGTLELAEDGSFRYLPEAGFTGLDSFIYFASDGTSDSRLAAVTIRVGDGGSPPVAVNDSYSVEEDGLLSVALSGGVLANDTDTEGDSPTAALVAGPASGSLALAADGSFTYVPQANFSGVVSFTYTASDASGTSSTATVVISVDPVNDKPQATNDAYDLAEDATLTIGAATGLLANDADVDGDTLTAQIVSQPLHGTLSLAADGSFVYTPETNYNGLDGFSYLVNDGTADSDVATVTFHIAAENDQPVTVNDEFTTAEDTPLEVAAPGVLANDSDVDGDALSSILVNPPIHGTVTLSADGALVYTPDANFTGIDGFSYLASDGGAESEVAGVTITVTAVNDAPQAANDEYMTAEDTPLDIAAPGVLANDSDVDGDALAVTIVNQPVHGTVVWNADGSFTYTPEANFAGTDGFSYVASDGTLSSEAAAVTITITAANDGPLAADDTYHMTEDDPLVVAAAGVLGNDTDPDGDALAAAVLTGPAHGTLVLAADGSFTYTPEANYSGGDSFTYQASDATGATSTATVHINICPVNDAPAAADDAYTVDEDHALTVDAAQGVLTNDSDPDGETLAATLVTGPASGTVSLAADGSFRYTPNGNFSGTDSFVYAAGDGTATAQATVTITVNPIADAPLAAVDFYSTGEDQPLSVAADLGVLANDLDPQGSGLAAELVDGPLHGTLSLAADGSFTYTPEANYHGTDSFTYKAKNGTEEMVASAKIVVEPLNDRPVAAEDAFDVQGGVSQAGPTGNLLANDSDLDGDALEARLVSGPAHGTLVLNADGSFQYTPEAGFTGDDAFKYQVFDGLAHSNVAAVALYVTGGPQNVPPANTRPLAVNDSFSVAAGAMLNIAPGLGLLANDSDPQGAALIASLFSGPLHGSLSLAADGSFTYSPEDGFVGLDAFLYRVSDGELSSALAAVTLHVTPAKTPEPAPVPTPDPCLAVTDDQGHELLDALLDGQPDLSSVDALFEQGIWLA